MTAAWRWLLGMTAGAVASTYSFAVALGLPYDEPAHWSNVRFLLEHHRLPRLGQPGSSYEAQMGPVAYVLDALVVAPLRSAGASEAAQAHMVRLLGVPVLLGLLWVVTRLVILARPQVGRTVAVLAACIAVLNPMVVAMTMSVQNDSLALLLGLLALDQGLRAENARDELVTGVLIGAAVLTKLTAWPVGPVLAVVLLRRHRRRVPAHLARLALPALAIAGWWFARNVQLYGDLTGQRGVSAAGFQFARYPSRDLQALGHMAGQVVTYLWLPVEYVRNTVDTPLPVKALVAATTAGIAVAMGRARGLRQPAGAALFVTGGSAFLAWAVTFLFVQSVAPRVAYLGLAAWGLGASFALTRLPVRWAAAGTGALLAGLHGWFLFAVAGIAWGPGLG